MTITKQQQHESGFLEAPLVWCRMASLKRPKQEVMDICIIDSKCFGFKTEAEEIKVYDILKFLLFVHSLSTMPQYFKRQFS